MRIRRFFQFQLFHVLVLMTMLGLALWRMEKIGLETCVVEIIEIGQWEEDSSSGPVVYWDKIHFRYLRPKHMGDYDMVLILKPFPAASALQEGQQFQFQLRTEAFLWYRREQPLPLVFERLNLQPAQIEEIISEKNWSGVHSDPEP
ncbi:MAG: hypothetical protein AAF939_08685 [Planctomycetota bacterium]